MPGWAYGHKYTNDHNLYKESEIDRCMNCGHSKPVKTRITMEFGEGNDHHGPICVKCYSNFVFNKITIQAL